MSDLTRQTKIMELSKKYDFHFTKSLGQNFLVDNHILEKIIDSAELSKEDVVFEIGTGMGVLTKSLAAKAGAVVAVEIDRHLIPILQDTLSNEKNVTILNQDILETDLNVLWKEYGGNRPIKVVANLPYYITTAIIMRFLESGIPLERMIFMVQKEVGQRLAAQPSTKEYGSLSVAVQYYCEIEKLFVVSRNSFIPPPKVDSLVIRLLHRKSHEVVLKDPELFFQVVRGAFAKRRKTIGNSLEGYQPYFSKEIISEALQKAGILPNRRGESLSLDEFATLSGSFFEIVSKINNKTVE